MSMKLEASLAMQEKAKRFIPGMTQLLSKRPDMFSLGAWPCYYSKAAGCNVWDLDGNQYVDMSISGIGANVLGYADPDVDGAVTRAIASGSSSSLNCPEEVELAEVLCDLHPWADMARFARTGGEAMAMAVRIARASTGREIVAFCGYHGWHDWYLSANLNTENALGEHLIPGLDPIGVPSGLAGTALPFRYNRLDELEAIIEKSGSDLAAIVMEPIRGTEPAPGFLQGVRALVNRIGAVLVFDEISAGFRFNAGGAHLVLENGDVSPDVAVFSKALGNGYPIAAVIGRKAVMEAAQVSFISSTCWTERIGPVAALATIRKHAEVRAGEKLVALGAAVQEGWKKLADKHDISITVSGMKPMSHFVFNQENSGALKALFIQCMLERGFLASNLYYAMWAHEQKHVDAYLEAVDEVFAEIANALRCDDVEKRLVGEPASAGFKRLA